MSSTNCPYCNLKAQAKVKTVFTVTHPADGCCPDCGAHIDAGQHSIEMNGYAEIYKGAIGLIDDIVMQFNKLLAYGNIDLSDYVDTEDGRVIFNMSTSEIIERLFVPYYGGTTKSNVAKALEIEGDSHIWFISKEEVDDEW